MDREEVESTLYKLKPVDAMSITELIDAHGSLLKWCDKNRVEIMEEIRTYSTDAYIELQNLSDQDFMSVYSPIFKHVELELGKRNVELLSATRNKKIQRLPAKRR